MKRGVLSGAPRKMKARQGCLTVRTSMAIEEYHPQRNFLLRNEIRYARIHTILIRCQLLLARSAAGRRQLSPKWFSACAVKRDKQRYRSGHNGADSKSVWEQSHEGSNPSRCASEEIPTTVPFPASPKTARWWEFLRFPPRLAPLDSRRMGTGEQGPFTENRF